MLIWPIFGCISINIKEMKKIYIIIWIAKDMVHFIVLQNKSAELVVSLARKRKRDRFKPAEK